MPGFAHNGYAVLRGFLAEPVRNFLHQYAVKSAGAGKLRTDDLQVPNSPSCYSDPFMEALLEVLLPRMEAESGLHLCPTYSYFRVYKRGDVLDRHTDRPSCEASMTLTLGCDVPWPIWIEADGKQQKLQLDSGDGLLYRGIDIPHWRETFAGKHLAQVFLHYVDREGPHKDWAFDKRASLGTSAAARRIVQQLIRSPDPVYGDPLARVRR
jgi:hypothetical protein